MQESNVKHDFLNNTSTSFLWKENNQMLFTMYCRTYCSHFDRKTIAKPNEFKHEQVKLVSSEETTAHRLLLHTADDY